MEITRGYAEFVSRTRYEDLPVEVVDAVKRAIVDTVATTIAGSVEPAARIALSVAQRFGGSEQATVVGTDARVSVAQAALVNGVAGHALDYDDVNYSMRGHPSIPVLPAVLALAEHTGATGRQAIAAFAVGFEVECKLGRTQGDSHYARGWHATSTHGTVGAAAAAAVLLDLAVEETAMALGIAASMAAGSRQNFGTMTKPLHPGRAAEAGVTAALLAQAGFTADEQMLEAPLGFIHLFSPAGDEHPELALVGLAEPFDIVSPGIAVKKYPCCYNTHRALDAVLALREENGIQAESIDQVEVRLPGIAALPLIHPRPSTGLEGKFSMEYCMAAALVDGPPRLGSFTDAAVQRPEVQALLRNVEMIKLPGEGNNAEGYADVTVRLHDGRSLQRRVDEPRGSGSDPLSWAELREKFLDCAGTVLSAEGATAALGMIERFDTLSDVSGLMRSLATSAPVAV